MVLATRTKRQNFLQIAGYSPRWFIMDQAAIWKLVEALFETPTPPYRLLAYFERSAQQRKPVE